MDADRTEDLVRVYHFSEQKLEQVLKKESLLSQLLVLISEAGLSGSGEVHKSVSNLLQRLPKGLKHQQFRPHLAKAIGSGDISKSAQLDAAFNYFDRLVASQNDDGKDDSFDLAAFNEACGVGVEISPEELNDTIADVLKSMDDALSKQGYGAYGRVISACKTSGRLRWADGRTLKEAVDAALLVAIGPRPPKVSMKGKNRKKRKAAARVAAAAAAKEGGDGATVHLSDSVSFHKPEENTQLTPEILAAHLNRTGGQVRTRFPPEPNGYLHLGHAKAMNLSFGYARKTGGVCYLRFDDTNPQAEKQEYIDSIKDNVEWMGHTPWKVTHASYYFKQLYDCACELIRRDKAFVCHQTAEEMKADREEMKRTHVPKPSPWRDRPVEESLRLFKHMKQGRFKEGEVTLRMKMDLSSPNPCMWDHVAYRIIYRPHPIAGDEWCIYPTYDFTHCLCDSFEDITHSLCTLEFFVRRESYNWLVDALELYRAPQWEYSRLNLTYTIMSKRKLLRLVNGGYVSGWDDPRMPTINGMRRKGFPPEAINDFCERIGITRSQNFQPLGMLEECVRQSLDGTSKRVAVVLDPLKVVIEDIDEDYFEHLEVANHPKREEMGTHTVPFSRIIYIERSDFRLEPAPGYLRLVAPYPGDDDGSRKRNLVRLNHVGRVVKCIGVEKNEDGRVSSITVTSATPEDRKACPKPKTIHWISPSSAGVEPLKATVRLYDRLFLSPYPEGRVEAPATTKGKEKKGESKDDEATPVKKDFLDDLNPNSLKTTVAYIPSHLVGLPAISTRLQFERIGFFCVDPDSTPDEMVFNRTVTLKHDKELDKVDLSVVAPLKEADE